jgi:phosphopantothenoylcysteine decarboxylase/phosphopantothenate--cysteine ligase
MQLKDKKIVIGVTGGIAAYKALELVRLLRKVEASVYVVMTKAATKFVTPLSFETLSKNPVSVDTFSPAVTGGIEHIDLATESDMLAIVPATANIIGKVAGGIADDLLSTLIMATTAPVLIAPAMNERMYENPIVRANIKKLRGLGYSFVGPDSGELACGWEGYGRLSSVGDIFDSIKEALSMKDLLGEKILVTAGATREALDPVRYLSNASSGKMGYSIASAARRRGAEVVLISGPSALTRPFGVNFVTVEGTEEMRDEVVTHFPQSTIVIMAAAVSDYKPLERSEKKLKKSAAAKGLSIELQRTVDILKEMGAKKDSGKFLVGFSLETEDLVKNATLKLKNKNLDMVVANSPVGLNSDSNEVTIIDKNGVIEELASMPKEDVAEEILSAIVKKRG